MNICVVGTGYVGLVTGACLADFGMNVQCVDKDEAKIAALQAGRIPIYEPGLEEIVAKNQRAGRLRFTTDLKSGIESALAIFIAVGTPPRPDGAPDLTFVRQVAEAIAEHMNGYKVVVTKSTVPTGTGRMIEQILRSNDGDREFSVVSNPEFLREGSAIADFLRPDRIVIGASDPRAIEVMKEVYGPLFLAETPFVITDVASAELIKYASNGFLAVKISFINEIARLCELMGADVHDVSRGMGLDQRIGSRFLLPGPGFGGSCFPKDTAAAVDLARQHGYRFRIIESAICVNAETKARMIDKIAAMGGPLAGRTVAVLGLSFKPETDDIRESPALAVIQDLVAAGSTVRAFDPAAMENARAVFPDLHYATDAYDCATGADVLVLATEWNEFRALDFGRLAKLMRSRTVVDLRNVYEPRELRAAGWSYTGVGRS
ncbi:MAG: UDP-glucose/GDP-mannose dehydrogenase family protein [Acidobacteriota bacterium]|nr:UDP-glucose/GDP-mannose dehydrogenase family protein [Acidobacteriota bacterium]MDQ5871528.1 UDP-glucose/GDP-mannose dehydrogenase family protein [Acidobacteriota bacterium]